MHSQLRLRASPCWHAAQRSSSSPYACGPKDFALRPICRPSRESASSLSVRTGLRNLNLSCVGCQRLRWFSTAPRSSANAVASSADNASEGMRTDGPSKEAEAAASPSASPAPNAEEASKETPKKDADDKPIGWGRFLFYAIGSISGVTVLYYFYKANFSLHQTEILLVDRFMRLPLYWPPGLGLAHTNSTIDNEGLPEDLVEAFCEWFIHTDLEEAGGVVRDDLLELFKEFGLDENHKAAKDFMMRGEGQLEEHRRLGGAGLQESITLLAKMGLPEDGSSPKVGPETVEILKRKRQRPGSVFTGALALQRAMKASPPNADS